MVTQTIVRDAAAAFATGATIAVILDIALQFLASAMHVVATTYGPPWWMRAAENSVWIAFGLVLWLASPLLGPWIDEVVPRVDMARKTTWNLVGLGMLTLPCGYVLGSWIVLAMQLTLGGTWAAEGRIFLSGAYYGTVLLSLTPWLAAGAIVRAWSTHMIE